MGDEDSDGTKERQAATSRLRRMFIHSFWVPRTATRDVKETMCPGWLLSANELVWTRAATSMPRERDQLRPEIVEETLILNDEGQRHGHVA